MKQLPSEITPNQLAQATNELKTYDLGSYEMPKKIQYAEKDYYVCVGVMSDTSNPLKPVLTGQTRFANRKEWDRMKKDLDKEKPVFKSYFGDKFSLVVILHNPRLPIPELDNLEDVEPEETTEEKFAKLEAELAKTKSDLVKAKKETPKKKEDPKPLNPTQKSKFNALMAEGKGEDKEGLKAIGKQLNVSLERLEFHIAQEVE